MRSDPSRKLSYFVKHFVGSYRITGVLIMLCVGSTVEIAKSELILPLAVCLPAMGLGLWAGMRIFELVSEDRFRRLVLWLILASGISLQF